MMFTEKWYTLDLPQLGLTDASIQNLFITFLPKPLPLEDLKLIGELTQFK